MSSMRKGRERVIHSLNVSLNYSGLCKGYSLISLSAGILSNWLNLRIIDKDNDCL